MKFEKTIWLAAAIPPDAYAHGFAQRYDLPVPLGLYIAGAAAAVAMSFVVVAFFGRGRGSVQHYPRLDVSATRAGRLFSSAWLVGLLRLCAVGVLALTIVGGFIGPQDPFRNLAPTVIWVLWWVGFAYVSGLLGDLWSVVNPWSAVYAVCEWLWARLVPGRRLGLQLPWPDWLGCWPAGALFVCFVWAELIWPSSDRPAALACAALGYSLVTWAGMFLFGRRQWLHGGEAFTIAFGYLARFSPSEARHGHWHLRPPAVGLLTERPVTTSGMVFVLLMLSSVTFDGLLATPVWADAANWMIHSPALRPPIVFLQDYAGDAVAAVATIALAVFLFTFQLLYLLFSALMRTCVPRSERQGLTIRQVAGLFVLSLVPIALAYHLAHYMSYLAIVGQYIIPIISDPFGLGWNLFGTRLYMVDISVVNARMVWYTSVIAIVAGHIVAVWLAHVMALRAFGGKRAALLSQIPMLLLMVAYTMLSLWILAQPVVETV